MKKTALAAAGLALMVSTAGFAATVEYKMTFVPAWNAATHPHEYPKGESFFSDIFGTKKGHFSGLIGATHNSKFHIFKVNTQPTPGLELLSEKGKPTQLAAEIDSAIQSGKAGALIKVSSGISGDLQKPVMTTFKATSKFPLVSVVAMLAPSPDWFVGVSNVQLYKEGQWLPVVAVNAYAWDSGGDSGQAFISPDQDNSPKKTTKLNTLKHFTFKGKPVPVGVFVFSRVPSKD